MTSSQTSFSVGIISWQGMHEAAAAIAANVAPHVGEVVVVHSEEIDIQREGEGRWITVPNTLFFGRKFEVLLSEIAPNAPLLLVQADAQCDDWPLLVRRCARAFRDHSALGVWAPLIDNTPFPAERTALRRFDGRDLVEVLNCDAIVLGLATPVVTRLGALSFAENNLGWGVDWAAVAFAATIGLKTVVDTGIHVHHPLARGYNGTEALSHLRAFVAQLTPAERAVYDDYDARLHRRVAERNGRNHMLVSRLAERGVADLVDALMARVAFMSVSGGRVRLCLAGPADASQPHLCVDDREQPFSDLTDPLAAPLLVDPVVTEAPGGCTWVPVEGGWRCPGQATLRAVFPPGVQNRRVRLAENFDIPASRGDVTLLLGAADHRCKASLHVSWVDADDPGAVREAYLPIDPAFGGKRNLGDFQSLRLRLPATGGGRVLTLTLCLWQVTGTGTEPGVLFVTRPLLVPTPEAEAPSVPLLALGAIPVGAGARWFEAAIPPTARALALRLGEERLPIPLDLGVEVTLSETEAGLTASAAKPMPAVLCVAGRATRRIWVGPVERVLGTINDWPRQERQRELRDISGSICMA